MHGDVTCSGRARGSRRDRPTRELSGREASAELRAAQKFGTFVEKPSQKRSESSCACVCTLLCPFVLACPGLRRLSGEHLRYPPGFSKLRWARKFGREVGLCCCHCEQQGQRRGRRRALRIWLCQVAERLTSHDRYQSCPPHLDPKSATLHPRGPMSGPPHPKTH